MKTDRVVAKKVLFVGQQPQWPGLRQIWGHEGTPLNVHSITASTRSGNGCAGSGQTALQT